jgi:diguanylate cyclase (GGDEF)-like protein
MIDADHFKIYNDQHGHQGGDAALAAIACCITTSVSDHASTARYGGEEFAVLLPGASLQEAFCAAESIRKSVASFPAPRAVSHPTVSIGITSQIPEHGSSAEDFVAAADTALYDAKRKGRNRTAAQQVMFVAAARRVA